MKVSHKHGVNPMSTTRSNRYAGNCAKCGAYVAADEGTLQGPPWKTFCTTCLPRVEAGVRFETADGKIRSSLTGYLGDTFQVYRQAMGGWKFNREEKAYYGTPAFVQDALSILKSGGVKIFVDEAVMDEAATVPEADVEITEGEDEDSQERLEVFKDFVETLDLEDIDPSEGDED